jgi:ComF family protein
LRDLVHGALDFCYPGVCANCEMAISGAGIVCADCDDKLTAIANAPACDHCAKPLASASGPCPWCSGKGLSPFDQIICLGVFDDPLKHLIHRMKYHGRWPLGEQLADRLIATERAKGLLTHSEVLVPVPLHLFRHVRRGYNQADVIARRIRTLTRIPVVHAVRRVRATETQTNLHSHENRIANVRDAFALRARFAKKIFGRHVVVVDDVTTSGATLQAVARLLKECAPASLCAMTLAIADPRHRGFEAI